MSHQFKDKIIWVTGASGALGRASALALAKRGAKVIASSRRLETLPDEPGISPLPLDVTRPEAIEKVIRHILDKHGRIDGLVTSTTVPAFGDFLDLPDAEWNRVIDAKLMGTVRPLRAALKIMIEQGEGRVVVLSGRGGIEPSSPLHLAGSSVNAALILLVRGLASRFGPDGIRINAVSPGPIKSPREEALRGAGGTKRLPAPIGHPGVPEDIADAVLFLLSDQARFISGENLVVDGGGRRFT